ncbi:MAG: restriction endonuclease subunit S [Methylococcales bacterium]|nr:restriction endonuclease subunit S [Methylococcales bacterium]
MKTLSEFIDFNPSVALEKGCDYSFIGMERIQSGIRYVQSKECRAFTGGGARFLHEDTLFARITPCLENGKIAQFVAEPGICGFGSTEFFVLRAKRGISDPSFVYYLAQTDEVQSTAIQSMVGASGRQRADINSLKTFAFALPALDKQQEIGKILSYYDDLIETNRRRIALLEESARLLYREWFVKLRFPGHESAKWQDGLPEGWCFVPLTVVAKVNRACLSVKSAPDIIQYIDISSVETGVIRETAEISFAEAPGRARRLVQNGDIIWSCVRPNRKSFALMLEPDENTVVSTGFAVLSTRTIPFSYLYLATTSDEFASFLSNRATGAAYPAVTAKDFEAAEVLIPSAEVLKDFHERCEPSLCLKHNLLKQNIALAKARDELLPKLMSGAIRI